jgi:hypothetical protein
VERFAETDGFTTCFAKDEIVSFRLLTGAIQDVPQFFQRWVLLKD